MLPRRLKDSIKVLLGMAKAVAIEASTEALPPQKLPVDVEVSESLKYFCPVCASPVKKFNALPDFYYENLDKYGFIFSIFQGETINLFNYSCPVWS